MALLGFVWRRIDAEAPDIFYPCHSTYNFRYMSCKKDLGDCVHLQEISDWPQVVCFPEEPLLVERALLQEVIEQGFLLN